MAPEDRKALIYRCKDAVAHLTQMVEVGVRGGRYSVTEHRYQLMINEIALASLTAQPIGRVYRGEVSDNNEYPNARVVCLHDQADWENFHDGTELFLRPATAVGMDKPEPYAWLVHAPQGDYVERNPEVVAHLEGTGLTKCKPLYLDL